jgi:tetratricopeptide (TPR) repeat protein
MLENERSFMRRALSLVLLLGCLHLSAQTKGSELQLPKQGPASEDPLAMGKNAMAHGEFQNAKVFFENYVKENPESIDAQFYLAKCEINLKNFDAAIADFQHIIAVAPKDWSSHSGLALAYAQKGDWAAFDKERAVIKDARDKNMPGVDKDHGDVVDSFTVNGEPYEVRYFYKLFGRYNVRYAFLHFGKDGNADHWIEIESLDVDQGMFAEKHPKEAAAGVRVYSMDSMKMSPSGFPDQGLIKFYEGEPTYETLRADAINAIQKQAKPSASSTIKK